MGRQTKNPRQNAPPVSPDQPPVPSLKAPGLRLTQRLVNDAPVTGFRQRIADHEVKGLFLRLTPGGARSYVLRYSQDRRRGEAAIGEASGITVKAGINIGHLPV